MNENKHYYAFISHNSKDKEIAFWLRDKLDNYHIPKTIQKKYGAPKSLKPCFMFQTDLAGSPVLKKSLETELDNSRFLIVVCSPNSAQPSCVNGKNEHYVNDEVQYFINTGRADRIIPFIIKGTPKSEDKNEECFCPALLSLEGDEELRGTNLNEIKKHLGNKMAAVANVIATMFGARFDEIWDKYKSRGRMIKIGLCMFILSLFAIFYYYYSQKIENLEKQAINVAEKVRVIAKEDPNLAVSLAYEVLPDSKKRKVFNLFKQPYIPEADFAFREALSYEGGTIPLNVQPVAVFPDGTKILACDGDNLCILDADDWTSIKDISGPFPSSGNMYSISQDGKKIATKTTQSRVCIIDVESNSICDTISNLLGFGFSISPTGTNIIGHNGGNMVYIYDQKGICNDTVALPSSVYQVSYSPSGKWIITSCNEGIFIWDSQTRKCVDTILGRYETKYNKLHDHAIFDQNEKTIATWSKWSGQGIVLWKWNSDTAKSDSINAIKIPDIKNIESVSFSPDGSYFVTQGYVSDNFEKGQYVCDNYIHLCSVNSSQPVKKYNKKMFQNITFTAFPSNDRVLFFYKDDKGTDYAQICSLDLYNRYKSHNDLTYKDFYTYHNKTRLFSTISTATFSPDGQRVLAAADDRLVFIDVQTGETATQILPKGVSCASFSPDGNFFAYILFDSTLCVIDSSGKLFERKLDKEFRYVSFSPDSKSVVSGGSSGCTFWDIKTEKRIQTIPSFSEMCFNHSATDAVVTNGQIDAISSKNFLHIRDRKHSKYVSYYPSPPGTVAFSPDDKYLASISMGGISVWKYKDLKSLMNKDKRYKPSHDSLIKPWLFIKGSFRTLNYSPNGKFLLATSSNGTHIFDAYRGVELCKLEGFRYASFSPDGNNILSVQLYGNSDVIRIYDFPPLQDLINQNRERIKGRPLTSEERHQYHLE